MANSNEIKEVQNALVEDIKDYDKNIVLTINGTKYSLFKGKDFSLPDYVAVDQPVTFKYKVNGIYFNIVGQIQKGSNDVSTIGVVESPLPKSVPPKYNSGQGISSPNVSARQTALDKAVKYYEITKEVDVLPEHILKTAEVFEAWLTR